MFLVIFGGLNSGTTLDVRDHLAFIDFYTPGIMAYAILLICFNSTALIFAALRNDGILKRVRTTPLPWRPTSPAPSARRRRARALDRRCCSPSACRSSARTCPARR